MRTFLPASTETTPLFILGKIISYSSLPIPSQTSPVGPLEITPLTRKLVVAGVWLSIFLASLNSALIATLLTSISSDLHATDQASWLGTSYLLATCTFTPLYGRLCDILGRRRASQLALFLAALSIILSVVSKNMVMLVVAQFINGVGGGGSFITAVIITSDMYILRHRGWIHGLSAVISAVGQGIAGPLGGYISEQFGWRWAFIFQLPLYVLAILLLESNLHYIVLGKEKSETTGEILKKIDYGGTISLMLSIFSFLAFLDLKYAKQLPSTDTRVLISLVFTIVMAIIFAIFELCVASQPILEPSFLRQKVPVLVGINSIITAINDVTSLYFLPLFFERVMLTSTAVAGSHLLPKSVAMTLGSLLGGAIIARTGGFKTLGIVAACTTLVGNLSLATLNENSSSLTQWLGVVPLGLGNTIVSQTTTIALLAHVELSEMAIALGFAQLWKCVGQVAGVAIPSAIFQQLIGRELAARITGPGAEEIIENIRQSARNVHNLPYDLRKHACDSYGVALRQVFWFLALLILVAVFIQTAIPGRQLGEHSDEASPPKKHKPTSNSWKSYIGRTRNEDLERMSQGNN